MHIKLKELADKFREEYRCNNAPLVVEKMLATVAGRELDDESEFTTAQLKRLSGFVVNAPFKMRMNITKQEIRATLLLLGISFVGGAIIGWASR